MSDGGMTVWCVGAPPHTRISHTQTYPSCWWWCPAPPYTFPLLPLAWYHSSDLPLVVLPLVVLSISIPIPMVLLLRALCLVIPSTSSIHAWWFHVHKRHTLLLPVRCGVRKHVTLSG